MVELEKLYDVLIVVEDSDKKLRALPTNTAMRQAVEMERDEALNDLMNRITLEKALKRYFLVRKGKVLLKRCLNRIQNDSFQQTVFSTLFQLLPLAVRRDKDDQQLPDFFQNVKIHLERSGSDSNLLLAFHYLKLLNGGSAEAQKTLCTFKFALTNNLGLTLIIYFLKIVIFHAEIDILDKEELAHVLGQLSNSVSNTNKFANVLEQVDFELARGAPTPTNLLDSNLTKLISL